MELTRQGYRAKTRVNALTLKSDMPAGQLLYINWGHYIIIGSTGGIDDGVSSIPHPPGGVREYGLPELTSQGYCAETRVNAEMRYAGGPVLIDIRY